MVKHARRQIYQAEETLWCLQTAFDVLDLSLFLSVFARSEQFGKWISVHFPLPLGVMGAQQDTALSISSSPLLTADSLPILDA